MTEPVALRDKALRRRWPDWEAARDAPVVEVEATIAGVTWPEQEAPDPHVLCIATRSHSQNAGPITITRAHIRL